MCAPPYGQVKRSREGKEIKKGKLFSVTPYGFFLVYM